MALDIETDCVPDAVVDALGDGRQQSDRDAYDKKPPPKGAGSVTAFRTVQVPVSQKGRADGPPASVNERLTAPTVRL